MSPELHLYTTSPIHLPPDLASLLSTDERQKSTRFHNPADRDQFLAARALTRFALSHHTAYPPNAWQFTRNAHGKRTVSFPALPDHLTFSVSHTQDLVACLIAQNIPAAAVDIEKMQFTPDLHLAAAEVLSDSERATLKPLPRREWTNRFFDLWTLKEAYAKARGLGLALDISHVEFTFDQSHPIAHFHPACPDHPADWLFLHHRTPTHSYAIAAQSSAASFIHHQVHLTPTHLDILISASWPANAVAPNPPAYAQNR